MDSRYFRSRYSMAEVSVVHDSRAPLAITQTIRLAIVARLHSFYSIKSSRS